MQITGDNSAILHLGHKQLFGFYKVDIYYPVNTMVYDGGVLEIPAKLYLRNVWMEVNGTISDSVEYTIDQKGSLSVWSTGHTANYPKGFFHFHNLTVRSQGLLYATATNGNTEVTINATRTVVNAGGVISGNRLKIESTNLTVDMAGITIHSMFSFSLHSAFYDSYYDLPV